MNNKSSLEKFKEKLPNETTSEEIKNWPKDFYKIMKRKLLIIF